MSEVTKKSSVPVIKVATDYSSIVSWVAPFLCIILGYVVWRFLLGNAANFAEPDLAGGFWPHHKGPKGALVRMYEGGIVVPILIGLLMIVITFSLERLFVIMKISGKKNQSVFIKTIQYHLASKNINAALGECDKQTGSLANVMRSGLEEYQRMVSEKQLNKEQKVLSIKKEVEEAIAREIPVMEKNMVFLSTITSLGTLVALLGTVIGMIRAFAALGEEGGGAGAATQLAIGISEALYNTAMGIGTGAIALTMYNVFTTRIDKITFGMDEAGYTLAQSYASLYE